MHNFHNLVRARSSDTVEDECEALCESSCSSASNSQHNIAIQATSALLASPPQASPMILLWQPNNRVRAPAHQHLHLLPRFLASIHAFFPSHLLTAALFLMIHALLC